MQNHPKSTPSSVVWIAVLVIIIALVFLRQNTVEQKIRDLFDGEIKLVIDINMAKTPEERDRLISQLEATPIKVHQFYSRWLIVHDIQPFHCWTDAGYDPSQSDVPRDIQLMAATFYGMSDIGNGGYDQFFSNDTGVIAPEMVEWFEKAGMKESAEDMRRAIALFGSPFPRSQDARRKILERLRKETTEPGNPFPIHKKGEEMISWEEEMKIFETKADQWLKEKYGITKIRQKWDNNKE